MNTVKEFNVNYLVDLTCYLLKMGHTMLDCYAFRNRLLKQRYLQFSWH